MNVEIKWIECMSYDEARNYSGIIYLHEWDDKPFYWGKCNQSFFGGHMRSNPKTNTRMSGRYNSGYKHWIEGCLKHGAKLFIGQLSSNDLPLLDDIENFLIIEHGSEMNTRTNPSQSYVIQHTGTIPNSVKLRN